MAEATIDELQIEIESDSSDASQSIEKLEQALQKLLAPVQALTTGSGLNKLTKQLEKLAEAGRAISGLSGFDKVAQASNALKSLDTLTGAPKVGSYVTALNKLSQAAAAVQTIATFPDITTQLMSLSNALNALRGVQDIRLTSLINGLSQLPAAVQAINSMPAIDVSRVEALNTAMEAFRTENAQQLKQLATALNRLPTVAQRINQIDFTQFANSIRQLTATLEPLMTRAEQAAQGLTALAQVMQAASRQSGGGNNVGDLNSTLGKLSIRSLVTWGALVKLKNTLAECFDISAQYVENLNLFNVTMGDTAKTAFEFAEAVNSALGVDTSDWIRYQGFFQSVGKGFGVVSEKADLMSQNLTQLAYDISSFYNISSEEAYNKVQSGFAGELEPLRRLGFALDEATLKQLAYKKGITQTYESMTQAQKAQLRYVAMIEQAENIGVTGDMSRTIDTASNGVRVLQARIQQFARAIGNMLMPMLSAMLPYLTAFVQVLTDAANALANVFGFELPKIELGGISNGYDDVAAAAADATAATEKFKGSLAGVDQLNIIGSHSDKSGSGDGYSTDLDIKLPTYDFLNGVESKTKQIAEDMKEWFKGALPWIEAVAAAIGSVFLTTSIVTFGSKLEGIVTTIIKFNAAIGDVGAKKFWGATGGLMAGSASGILLFNSLKKISSGAKATANDIVQLASGFVIAGGAIAAFIALGNPLGAVITGIGAVVGLVAGIVTGLEEKSKNLTIEIAETSMYAEKGGLSVEDLANAFSGYFGTISAGYQDIIDTSNAIADNKERAGEAAAEIYNLTDKYRALGEAMSAEDAETLKANLDVIGDAIQDNLGLYTQTMVDNLKGSFHDLAVQMGLDVDDMIGKWYLLENMGNTALSELKKNADELSLKVIDGTATAEEYAEFNDTVAKMATVDTHTAEQEALNRAFKEITNGSIDFESSAQVESAIEQIKSAAESAKATTIDAWNRQRADTQNYKETLSNWGVDVAYDEKFGAGSFEALFNEQLKLLDTGYTAELDKIERAYSAGIGMIAYQVNQNKDQAVADRIRSATFWDTLKASGDAYMDKGLLIFDDYKGNASNYLKSNIKEETNAQYQPIYDALAGSKANYSEYEDAAKNIIKGLADGTINSLDDFVKAIDQVADAGISAFEEKCEIHSPSKVFAELGGYVTEGLAVGILKEEDTVEEAIKNIADLMTSNTSRVNETGYVWAGAKEISDNRNVGSENETYQAGDIYISLEVDGEELASAAQHVQAQRLFATNGR